MRYPSPPFSARIRRPASGSAILPFVVCFLAAAAPPTHAASSEIWPAFRGPDSVPVSENAHLPLRWSRTENVEWKATVPGMGWSSPIVVGGQVYLTTATSETEMKPPQIGTEYSNEYIAELMQQGLSQKDAIARLEERDMEFPDEVQLTYWLIAFDLATGEEVFRRAFHEGRPPGGRHRKNSYTSETPVSDGSSVYVYVGNLGLWAFSLDGEPRWHTELESYPVYLDFGTGGSPALLDDKIIVLNDNQKNQFLAAFSTRDGKELWRTKRDLAPPDQPTRRSGWATPFVWRNEQRTEIIAQGPYVVISYDTRGKELWRMAKHSLLPTPSPFAYDGRLYLVSGVHGDNNRPIAAILPGAAGDLTLGEGKTRSESVLWLDPRAGTYIPTPVPYKGSLWVVYDKGIFARYDAKTGERLYRARIDGSAGAFTSSPWAYRDRIFAIDEDGTTFVFGTGDTFEQLGSNPLDEMVLATPAMAGDRLLIRTKGHLYSIRERP